MYYIFTTKTAATQYDRDVTALHNFDTTSNWATPIKHPTKAKWAIMCSPKLILESKQPQELTADWIHDI
jgi:hypothetical protein